LSKKLSETNLNVIVQAAQHDSAADGIHVIIPHEAIHQQQHNQSQTHTVTACKKAT